VRRDFAFAFASGRAAPRKARCARWMKWPQMARALNLAERGRLTTAPNPWVGCLILRDGAMVGQGFYRRAGEPHAEVHALHQAGERARGATAYVTLEPCAHHGRTLPCVDALVRAGLSRVVVAVLDPDPRLAGRGVTALRDAGIHVDVGLGANEATASFARYLHQRRTGSAFCIPKAAVSIDGRTARRAGSPAWQLGPTRTNYAPHHRPSWRR
jgi:diaminohydroxyphosphoribosylaminopyrimidine deaminase / 5-amino-6-(5-phosphoribosylamino)uracil reductase